MIKNFFANSTNLETVKAPNGFKLTKQSVEICSLVNFESYSVRIPF